MKWLIKLSNVMTGGEKLQVSEVKEAADKALKQYDKTFKDLARYDRGEKILHAVSK